MKKLSVLLVMASLIIPSMSTVNAADSMITFDGDAEKFINANENNEVFDGFKNMYPGETRTQSLTLKNDDYREMRFYMSSKIVDEFGNEITDSSGIAYDVNFTINGEDLFDGQVGGEDRVGMTDEGEQGDNILVATLGQGETALLEMTLTADGDTMDNSYQDASGHVEYTFSVEYDDEPATVPEKIVNTITKTVINPITKVVKTGDPVTLGVFGVMLGASAVGIVYLIITRKKKEEDAHESK